LYKRKGKFEIKRAKLGKFNELNLNKAASQIFISNLTRRTITESSREPSFGGS